VCQPCLVDQKLRIVHCLRKEPSPETDQGEVVRSSPYSNR
jgi:hypothetical protein